MDKTSKYYFMKIPNVFFKCDSNDEWKTACDVVNIPRLVTIYILINRYRTMAENISWLSFGDIFNFYGYKKTGNKPKSYYEILETIKYLETTEYISIINKEDIKEEPSYKTVIKIQANEKLFDPAKGFIKFLFIELHAIMEIVYTNNISMDLAIIVYLYIKSNIMLSKKEIYIADTKTISEEFKCKQDDVKTLLTLFSKSSKNYLSLLLTKKEGSNNLYKINQNFDKKTENT